MMNSFRIALSIFFIVALATTTSLLVKKRHHVDVSGAATLLLLEGTTAQGGIPGDRNNPGPGEVLVKFKPYVTDVEIERIAKISGMEVKRTLSPPNLFLFKITGNSSLREAIRSLERFDEVEYSTPNHPRKDSG